MSNEEMKRILVKAITKAEANGYIRMDKGIDSEESYGPVEKFVDAFIETTEDEGPEYTSLFIPFLLRGIILDKPFAQALWGKEIIEVGGGYWKEPVEKWEYHLSQMVVAPDLLEYLDVHS